MDKKYWEDKEITVYWWNGGTKTLDFKGTYRDFLEKRDIKVKCIASNGCKGYRFTIPLSSCKAIFDTFATDYSQCCDDAIKIFLTLLGDKSKFLTPHREYFINWR